MADHRAPFRVERPGARIRDIVALSVLAGIAGSILGIAAAGSAYYRSHRDGMKAREQEALEALAAVKVREIARWRQERMGDAGVARANPLLARAVAAALDRGSKAEAEGLRSWMKAVLTHRQYSAAFLADGAGRVRIAVQDYGDAPADCPDAGPAIVRAIRTGESELSDLHRDAAGAIHLDLAIPFSGGALLLRVDPYRDLYPTIQTWPGRSPSAEIILARRDGSDVLFLNELRSRKNTALSLRMPLTLTMLPAAIGARGVEGAVEGVDYRGVRVLAATRRVPDSPWVVVAKVDAEEIYGPIRGRAWMVAAIVTLLALGIAAAAGYLWRQQQARFYRRLYVAETERKALAVHYENLARFANDMILMIDADMAVVEANERACAAYGYSREELLGMSIRDLRATSDLASLADQWKRADDPRGVIFETVHRRRDGTEFPVEVSSRTIEVEGRKCRQSIIRDISERKRAEARLRQALETLNALVQTSPLAIVLTDLEGKVKLWNPAAAEVFGWSADETIGGEFPVVPEGEREGAGQLLDRARAGESVSSIEARRQRKDGSIRDMNLWTAPVRDAHGGVNGCFAIYSDVTERNRMEDKLRHTQRLESIGVLAGGVAHDFNNILTAILGYSRLLREHAVLDPEETAWIDAVVSGAERAADLTRQLLAYAGKGKVQLQRVDLADVVREMSLLAESSIPPSVTLELDLPRDLPMIEGDRGQIQQVVMNLVINAAEAIVTGSGAVKVTVRECETADAESGRSVCLEVADNGCGMDEATINRIFDPFFTTKFQGRGLGLSAVLGIVRSHRGEISVDSAPGRGTTFRVVFPALDGADQLSEAIEAAQHRGEGLILVVDDEPDVASYLKTVLERVGYEVLTAADGRQALGVITERSREVAAVVLDMTMPLLTGEDALRAIRGLREDLPVIVCSGFGELEVDRRFAGQKVEGFLQKPFPPRELIAKLDEVLKQSRITG